MLGEDSRRKNGGQGQAVGHKETRKQVSVPDTEGEWAAFGLVLPGPARCCPCPAAFLWLIWICSLQLQDDPHLAVFPFWLAAFNAGQYSVNLDP